jgi:hypothetical protein
MRERLTRIVALHGLADTTPSRHIWGFREALMRARLPAKPAIEVLFARFEATLFGRWVPGDEATSGQIIDASIVAAGTERTDDDEAVHPQYRRIGSTQAKIKIGLANLV